MIDISSLQPGQFIPPPQSKTVISSFQSKTGLPKLDSTEKLEALLNLLNKESNRYMSVTEIEGRLGNKFDGLVLLYAEGLNDKLGPSNPFGAHSTEYLADVAQIWQTKLIDRMDLIVNGKTENCYMIKVKGIEVLNQLQLNKNIIDFNESSYKTTIAIALLTVFLVVLGVLQIMILLIQHKPQWFTQPTQILVGLIMIGVIVIEYNLFKRNKFQKTKTILQNEIDNHSSVSMPHSEDRAGKARFVEILILAMTLLFLFTSINLVGFNGVRSQLSNQTATSNFISNNTIHSSNEFIISTNYIIATVQWLTLIILCISLLYLGLLRRNSTYTEPVGWIIACLTALEIGFINVLLYYSYLLSGASAATNIGALKIILFESNPIIAAIVSIALSIIVGVAIWKGLM